MKTVSLSASRPRVTSHGMVTMMSVLMRFAVWLLKTFMNMIKKHHTYRNSEPTTSILTITSNVVYGKVTGAMPDGRQRSPFLQVLTHLTVQRRTVFLASLNSVAKLPYEYALDGISNTQTISPGALGI